MKHNMALNTSRIFIVFLLIIIASMPIFAQRWVDMGFRGENGDIIYWSSSDFALYRNGTVGFVEYGEEGSTFGWGDISGEKTGRDLSQYGGQNPPNKIEGNPKYDIVTAKLGSPYRLPTQREIQALIDNCSIERTTIDRGTPKGSNGLPSWVQGQWMINDAVLIGDRVINSAVSIRIDGFIASYYITSGNIFWEGPYSYSGGKITIGNLTFIVDDEKKVLKDRSNNVFKKISSRTVSNQVTGILFTSKINGNQLLFAMPPSVSTYSSSNYSIVTTNSQEIDYWTGTLFDKNSDYAVGMKMTSYEGFGVIAQSRSYHSRIRAIKVEIGSGAKFAEEKRISDSIANEKKRIADSIAREEERQRQEILETKRKSIYGEWIGKYGLFGKIKLVIDNTRMSFYLSGSLIEECPIRISVNGYDIRVEFLEKGDIYYRDELLLSYEQQRTSYMQQIGYVTIRTYNYYNIKYEQGRFKVYCREVNESDNRAIMRSETKNTVVLYKSVEKKDKQCRKRN